MVLTIFSIGLEIGRLASNSLSPDSQSAIEIVQCTLSIAKIALKILKLMVQARNNRRSQDEYAIEMDNF